MRDEMIPFEASRASASVVLPVFFEVLSTGSNYLNNLNKNSNGSFNSLNHLNGSNDSKVNLTHLNYIVCARITTPSGCPNPSTSWRVALILTLIKP